MNKEFSGLIVTPEISTLAYSGSSVRIHNISRGLNNYFNITFAGVSLKSNLSNINFPYDHVLFAEKNEPNIFSKFSALFSSWPYHTKLYYSFDLHQKLNRLIKNNHFDFIYCNYIYTLPYFININRVIPIFLDQHNVDQEYWGRKVKFSKTILHKIISFVNLKKTIHFEKSLLSKINTYISVSELDRKNTIKYAFPIVKNFLVAPNGVNIHEYKNINHILTRSKKITLGFLGSMNLEINQNAAFQIVESILPDVKIALPDFTIQLMIIGKDPPDSIRNLEKNNEIFVTGTVESTKMYLEKINIFICPIIGGAGTKLRLFEVMSLGIPSVGYPYLFQGVEEIVHGHNAFIANNLEEFINYTIILSKNSDLREKIGVNARDMIVKNYDWNRITKKLSADIELILKNNQN